jgi:hypothetical protein
MRLERRERKGGLEREEESGRKEGKERGKEAKNEKECLCV